MLKAKLKANMNNGIRGKIIVIVAPSGTGKSTLIKRLKEGFPSLRESVSFTTRPMRAGEKEGVNYFYITEEEFKKKIGQSDFLEWALVHSNYYGTSKSYVEESLKQGHHLLFDLDVQGADAMKENFGHDAKVVFIEPPSVKELENRLNERGTESRKKIEERLENARKELLRKDDYDYLVMNDDVDKAYKALSEIFNKIMSEA